MGVVARDQLTDWIEQLSRIDTEVRLVLEPLSEAQFAWRPEPGRWSVGECLDHLAITTGLVLGRVGPALEQARAEGRKGEPPFAYGWVGGWFVRAMERPGPRGMRSPPNFLPPAGAAKSAVLGRFAGVQHELRDTLEGARGLALDRIKVTSAARGAFWLRLNVAAWLASTLAHARRHVAQARRVTETAGFPPA